MTSYANPGTLPPEQEPTPGWGQSLSGGAGLALLHIAYARAGIGDWFTAHQWVTTMTCHPVAAHTDASLYQGAPAVTYVLRTAARPTYSTVLGRLDQHIAEITRTRLGRAHERIDRGELPELREFDLINGLTGLGVYLLHALPGDLLHPHTDLLREVLVYLVRLTGTVIVDGAKLPGWWTTTGPSGRPDPQWPGGHANLGLAHGIAGPLALLSAAMIRGVTVPGQAEAIDRTDAFLDARRCGPPTRPWWPGMISACEWATATIIDQPGPQRPSWCYGTPGMARARQLAGLALADPRRRYRAEAALATCLTDDAQLDQLRDDSLCHGWAGLVHTARRATADADSGQLAEILPHLESRWRRHRKQARPQLSDPGGMLEGGAGVALTILSGAPAAGWDACLLTTVPTSLPTTITHTEGPA